MSPVERTAAWVLNNGQYEEAEEDTEQNPDEAKHAEKVEFILNAASWRVLPSPTAEFRGAFRCRSSSHAFTHRLCWQQFLLYMLSHIPGRD